VEKLTANFSEPFKTTTTASPSRREFSKKPICIEFYVPKPHRFQVKNLKFYPSAIAFRLQMKLLRRYIKNNTESQKDKV
jgi:hypothetical protein